MSTEFDKRYNSLSRHDKTQIIAAWLQYAENRGSDHPPVKFEAFASPMVSQMIAVRDENEGPGLSASGDHDDESDEGAGSESDEDESMASDVVTPSNALFGLFGKKKKKNKDEEEKSEGTKEQKKKGKVRQIWDVLTSSKENPQASAAATAPVVVAPAAAAAAQTTQRSGQQPSMRTKPAAASAAAAPPVAVAGAATQAGAPTPTLSPAKTPAVSAAKAAVTTPIVAPAACPRPSSSDIPSEEPEPEFQYATAGMTVAAPVYVYYVQQQEKTQTPMNLVAHRWNVNSRTMALADSHQRLTEMLQLELEYNEPVPGPSVETYDSWFVALRAAAAAGENGNTEVSLQKAFGPKFNSNSSPSLIASYYTIPTQGSGTASPAAFFDPEGAPLPVDVHLPYSGGWYDGTLAFDDDARGWQNRVYVTRVLAGADKRPVEYGFALDSQGLVAGMIMFEVRLSDDNDSAEAFRREWTAPRTVQVAPALANLRAAKAKLDISPALATANAHSLSDVTINTDPNVFLAKAGARYGTLGSLWSKFKSKFDVFGKRRGAVLMQHSDEILRALDANPAASGLSASKAQVFSTLARGVIGLKDLPAATYVQKAIIQKVSISPGELLSLRSKTLSDQICTISFYGEGGADGLVFDIHPNVVFNTRALTNKKGNYEEAVLELSVVEKNEHIETLHRGIPSKVIKFKLDHGSMRGTSSWALGFIEGDTGDKILLGFHLSRAHEINLPSIDRIVLLVAP